MSDFLKAMQEENSFTFTENGALTFSTSLNANLDFFSLSSAMRDASEEDILSLWSKAFEENETLALRNLFYLRDVRGGQGERRAFRVILNSIAKNFPYYSKEQKDIIISLIPLISKYGRFDDLFSLFNRNKNLNKYIILYIESTLIQELHSEEEPSLLAKWMPSENTSSIHTKKLARKVREMMGWSSKRYRLVLSTLRRRIKLVEQEMSANRWDQIEFDKVPSQAIFKYKNAFIRHTPEKYERYLKEVNEGQKDINTSTLYPYQIISKFFEDPYYSFKECSSTELLSLETMWKNLPNYIREDDSAIVVCDVSGSMMGTPITVSVSLALYFAERAKGPYKNHFITFSVRPKLEKITGVNISKKVRNISRANWDSNTDIGKVFELILKTAKSHDLSADQLPSKIYIISDMEFDACAFGITNFSNIQNMYEEAGYKMPLLVFWNVNARSIQVPVRENQTGAILISGCSPSTFRFAMEENSTPEKFMLKVLNDDRYNIIKGADYVG